MHAGGGWGGGYHFVVDLRRGGEPAGIVENHGDSILIGDRFRRGLGHVLDRDRVDSVPLIRRRLVLAHEHVTEVRAAAVADYFDGTAIGANAHVALITVVKALVEGVPTAVLELAR